MKSNLAPHPVFTKRHRVTRNTFNDWHQRSKYNRVQRAHPFKAREADCRWQAITTPRGRKILMAVA